MRPLNPNNKGRHNASETMKEVTRNKHFSIQKSERGIGHAILYLKGYLKLMSKAAHCGAESTPQQKYSRGRI